jgi:ABC-2 type transport system permease protein
MDTVLLGRTFTAQRGKLLIVSVALAIWGVLMPLVYAEIIDTPIGAQFQQFIDSGLVPRELTEFGGGNIFTLPGAITLGIIHPIAVALSCVFAVGFAAAAVAGERQRGTLEVLLARPVSRRTTYGTLFVATAACIAAATAAALAGTIVSAGVFGVLDQLDLSGMPLLWLNATLLYLAIASVALAASVTFDRLAPALSVAVGFAVVSYFLEILGSLWDRAEPLQPLSVFHYLDPQAILDGQPDPIDLVVLAAVVLAGAAWALVVFPRRDLSAPI